MDQGQRIKDYALELGFDAAGITTADDFDAFKEEFDSRGEIYKRWWKKFSTGYSPRKMFPEGRSIIVLAYDYIKTAFPEELKKYIGRVYMSASYMPPEDSFHGKKLRQFEDFLTSLGIRFVSDGNTLPIRRAAVRAGIASFGKNNFISVKGHGSFVVLYGYIVDAELTPDEPAPLSNCPPDCHLCIDACPTQAIYEPFHLDPARCIGYNNWIIREGETDYEKQLIPRELRAKIGTCVHGCDRCQEVCPKNRAAMRREKECPKDDFLEEMAGVFDLEGLYFASDEYYEKWIRPVMYNYIKDFDMFRRNALIAMANSGGASYMQVFKTAIEDRNPLIRSYAAWALGETDTAEAKEILKRQFTEETDERVREEIEAALA